MNLVDANVLLYAVNESDPKHEPSRRWLDGALGGQETVASPGRCSSPSFACPPGSATTRGRFPSPPPSTGYGRGWTSRIVRVPPAEAVGKLKTVDPALLHEVAEVFL